MPICNCDPVTELLFLVDLTNFEASNILKAINRICLEPKGNKLANCELLKEFR